MRGLTATLVALEKGATAKKVGAGAPLSPPQTPAPTRSIEVFPDSTKSGVPKERRSCTSAKKTYPPRKTPRSGGAFASLGGGALRRRIMPALPAASRGAILIVGEAPIEQMPEKGF